MTKHRTVRLSGSPKLLLKEVPLWRVRSKRLLCGASEQTCELIKLFSTRL